MSFGTILKTTPFIEIFKKWWWTDKAGSRDADASKKEFWMTWRTIE